jgi:hypothetical protein
LPFEALCFYKPLGMVEYSNCERSELGSILHLYKTNYNKDNQYKLIKEKKIYIKKEIRNRQAASPKRNYNKRKVIAVKRGEKEYFR